ncbi:MAG: sporulation protein [Chthonomonadaceae bacterium]|nr:sporulation protein [Chthonomonadaceae bacterium]
MFLEEFMARIGVGTATLTLKLQKTQFFHGDTIEGSLILEGGAVEQHVERFLVMLSEYHAAGKNSYWKTVTTVDVTEAVLIAPHQVQEYAFQLPVPDVAHITTSDYAANSTRIVAEADILWAVNPSVSVDVQITPDPEILVLDAAMNALGFTTTHQLFSEPMNPSLKAVQKTYIAPSSLQDQITDATLQVHNGEGKLSGRLILNHRELHLADYVKAIVGGDKEKLPLEIPSEQLLGEQGLTLATAILQQMLDQALHGIDSK